MVLPHHEDDEMIPDERPQQPWADRRYWPDGKRMDARPCGLCLGLGCRMCKGTGRYEPGDGVGSVDGGQQ